MSTEAEVKLRTLAAADPALQAIFGTTTFRWFMFGQLPAGYIKTGTCARVRRVSTRSDYVQEGPLNLERIRFQFDFLDQDPATALAAARAVADWMLTVDLMSDAQFVSPTSTPRQFPNYQQNQRSWIEALPEAQVFVAMDEWVCFNNSST